MTETADAVLIHDRGLLGDAADPAWFEGVAGGYAGGRGAVARVETPAGPAVLRRYRRGGLVARLLGDRYLFTRRERTRPFREFRLMAVAADAGLPVPRPLAARYARRGIWYRAELLVAAVEGARTLAQCLESGATGVDWRGLGTAIGELHAAGIRHADLNAHNLLLDGDGAPWVIDFDRGERRAPAPAWQQANLSRLARSLAKLGAPGRVPDYAACWQALCEGHRAAVAPAPAPPR